MIVGNTRVRTDSVAAASARGADLFRSTFAFQMSDTGFGNISFVSNASNTPAVAQVVIP